MYLEINFGGNFLLVSFIFSDLFFRIICVYLWRIIGNCLIRYVEKLFNLKRIRNFVVCILGMVDKVYILVFCSKGLDDNYKNSFLII